MTFEEWWAWREMQGRHHMLVPGIADEAWHAATEAERERCAPVLKAAQELLDDVKLRYDLESDEELECEHMRSLAVAIRLIQD